MADSIPTTIYDNGEETMTVIDYGEDFAEVHGSRTRFYGFTQKYDVDWDTEIEADAWLTKYGFTVIGWDKINV